MLRSRHLVPLLVLTVIIGGLTVGQAFVIDWLPGQASEQAVRTDRILWFVFWASAAIFTLVTVVVVYCAIAFRARPGDESDGPPTHGNTRVEIIWTIVPTILLAVIAVWAYLVLSDNEALAGDRMMVDVTAEQFAWSFTYPEAGITSGDLRLPVGRQVELRMRAKDVIHDLYVPEFRVKQDVVPGITTREIINPNRAGTYPIICAELCGLGHNTMRSQVIVMQPAAYAAWLDDAKRQAAERGPGGRGQAGQGQGGGSGTTTTTTPAP